MIETENLIKKYGERTVLDIEKLSIPDGMRLALTGPNGSGKSTFLKILAGVIKKTSGDLRINGKVLYMPQNSTAFNKTVLSNLLYGLKGDKKENIEKCKEALETVGLGDFCNKSAVNLSGGEKQRLALARILVRDSDILLLDEPTGAVDVEGTEIIENAVNAYVEEQGCTLIFATHSPAEAKNLSDKIIMLNAGKIVEYGTPAELLSSPATEWGKKFIDMWRL